MKKAVIFSLLISFLFQAVSLTIALSSSSRALVRVEQDGTNDVVHSCPPGSTCCPVCGMTVEAKSSVDLIFNEGQELHTCSAGCAHLLMQNPLGYQINNSAGLKSGRAITGDMHGEDELEIAHDHDRDHNGASIVDGKRCPVCGMQATQEHYIDFKGNQALHFCGMARQVEKFVENPTAYLQATKKSDAVEVDQQSYCSGRTVMYMYQGFTTNDTTCIVLWFSSFILDSRTKVFLGVIFCFLLAVFHEYLSAYRRGLVYLQRLTAHNGSSTSPNEKTSLLVCEKIAVPGRRNRQLDITVAALYGVSITLGYLLMLAAMTYHSGLFIAVVLGFSCGQYMFKDCDSPVVAGDLIEISSEPCCAV
eukprot:CFRG4720T1